MFICIGSDNVFVSRLFKAKILETGSLALQPDRYEIEDIV